MRGDRSQPERGYFPRSAKRPEPTVWPRICTCPTGCDQPVLPGRAVCRRHADELERRGEELRRRAPDHRAKGRGNG